MRIKLDVMTCNILIKSCERVGVYQKMEFVLDCGRKRFQSSTVVTYCISIEILDKAGLIKNLEQFFLQIAQFIVDFVV